MSPSSLIFGQLIAFFIQLKNFFTQNIKKIIQINCPIVHTKIILRIFNKFVKKIPEKGTDHFAHNFGDLGRFLCFS